MVINSIKITENYLVNNIQAILGSFKIKNPIKTGEKSGLGLPARCLQAVV